MISRGYLPVVYTHQGTLTSRYVYHKFFHESEKMPRGSDDFVRGSLWFEFVCATKTRTSVLNELVLPGSFGFMTFTAFPHAMYVSKRG